MRRDLLAESVFGVRPPHSEAPPASAIGMFAPVQIEVKPISQTSCKPYANSEQQRNSKN
jgi:hypothetical protein